MFCTYLLSIDTLIDYMRQLSLSDNANALHALCLLMSNYGSCIEREIFHNQEQKKIFERIFANIYQIIAEKMTLGSEPNDVRPSTVGFLQDLCDLRTVT